MAEGHGASVASIARRIGVTHSAVLQRFGTKRNLFLRAMCPEGPPERVVDTLLRGPRPDVELHRQLRPMLAGLLAFLRQLLPQLLALRAAGVDLVDQEGEAMPTRLRVALAAWVRAASGAGRARVADPEAVAEGLLGALEARALNEHLGVASRGTTEDTSYIDTLLRGLLPATTETTETKKDTENEPTQE